jgi:hypothetical protein
MEQHTFKKNLMLEYQLTWLSTVDLIRVACFVRKKIVFSVSKVPYLNWLV